MRTLPTSLSTTWPWWRTGSSFTKENHREARGINLDFDAGGHLVGVEFEEAERQLPDRRQVTAYARHTTLPRFTWRARSAVIA